MILVDTSVWIAFFRRGSAPAWAPRLARALADDELVLVEPVITELLGGARTAKGRSVLLDLADNVRTARLDRLTWVAAGDLAAAWRARGRTLSVVDALLATVAVRDALPLWTLDRDFDPLFVAGEVARFEP